MSAGWGRPAAAILAALLMAAALLLPAGAGPDGPLLWRDDAMTLLGVLLSAAGCLIVAASRRRPLVTGVAGLAGLLAGAVAPLAALGSGAELGLAAAALWLQLAGLWLLAWLVLEDLSRAARTLPPLGWLVPALFGAWLLFAWEVVVRGFGVPPVLLPAPSRIAVQLAAQAPTLLGDFRQTFLKSVLAGWAMGSAAGFVVALLIDRVPFLQRGLLPYGNLVSAVPIVGIAPIMVMWFGFDWQSKAAVIVVMTFFPMLINTLAGFAAADGMSRDLMRSYGAGYGQTFLKLRLPAALPFIFNALKINSTLALIGAIVSEFFGSPIAGLGFRISVEIGRMNVDVVWATIAVAAVAGSIFYGVLALLERLLTFWHPSYRR
ncbi:MAG: ABC transporter permease [Dongiaceae bacterium]